MPGCRFRARKARSQDSESVRYSTRIALLNLGQCFGSPAGTVNSSLSSGRPIRSHGGHLVFVPATCSCIRFHSQDPFLYIFALFLDETLLQRGRKRKKTNREFGTCASPRDIQFSTRTWSFARGSVVIAAPLATVTRVTLY